MLNKNTKAGTERTVSPAEGEKKTLWQRLRSPATVLLAEGIMAISGLGVGVALQGCNNTPISIESIKSQYRKLNDRPISMRANEPSRKSITFGRDTFECDDIIKGATYNEPDFVAMHARPAGEFGEPSIGIKMMDTVYFYKKDGLTSYKVECLDIRIKSDVDREADFNFYIME